ncbi:MAG: tRNA guanosine(34) transglycosylase Tgt [Nannocystaceae bacterium]
MVGAGPRPAPRAGHRTPRRGIAPPCSPSPTTSTSAPIPAPASPAISGSGRPGSAPGPSRSSPRSPAAPPAPAASGRPTGRSTPPASCRWAPTARGQGLDRDDLVEVGSQIILGNSYHLAHRPGARIRELGGLHQMAAWERPILTDSGGFQVFSLRGLQKIDDGGVDYQTHFDGSRSRMTPRSVLEVQAAIGSDICMILDHCPPGDAPPAQVREAMDRSTRWAREAAALRPEILCPGQLCFGIVQGGVDLALRRAHLETIAALPFDGVALGGLSVGESIGSMHATIAAIAPEMPTTRPRYVMGIGTPLDLLVAVRSGIDMFDCVMPTRNARNGQLFTFGGRINIRQARYRDDPGPVDPACACRTCRRYGRAYLRHLHEQQDPLYGRLASLHNLFFFHQWVAVMRLALRTGRFAAAVRALEAWVQADGGGSAADDGGDP